MYVSVQINAEASLCHSLCPVPLDFSDRWRNLAPSPSSLSLCFSLSYLMDISMETTGDNSRSGNDRSRDGGMAT